MEINHRITIAINRETKAAFAIAGLDIELHRFPESSNASLDMLESDCRWAAISPQLRRFRSLDIVWTLFSEEELLASKYVAIMPGWVYGYPQPSDNFRYLNVTYDRSEFCGNCGTGLMQKASFRMKGEPPWGKRAFSFMNWVDDEVFIRSDVWQSVLEPLGIKCLPVQQDRSRSELKTVVQMDTSQTVPLDIRTSLGEMCPICRTPKYGHVRRGPYPPPDIEVDLPTFRSNQYFGADSTAYRQLMIRQSVYREITKMKLKGLCFGACGFWDGTGGITFE